MTKYIILIIIVLSIDVFSFEQTGPTGVDLCMMKIDEVTGFAYATTYHNKLYKVDLENNDWIELEPPEYGNKIKSLDAHNNVIFLGIGNHILRSLDGGINWEYCESGIQYDISARNLIIYKPQPEIIFAQVGLNIWFRSNNNGTSWNQQLPNIGGNVYDFSPDYNLMMVISSSYLYKSFDAGVTWEEIPLSFFNYDFFPHSLVIINDSTYVSGGAYWNDFLCENNMFITYDSGVTWENINYGFSYGLPKELKLYNNEIYLSAVRTLMEQDAGVLRLDMENETWIQIGNGIATDVTGLSIKLYDNNIYLASLYEGIFEFNMTTEIVNNLIPTNIYEKTVFTLKTNPNYQNYIYQNVSFMYLSDDYGYTWSRMDSIYNVLDVRQSPIEVNYFIASRARKGIYISDDYAQTWIESNDGIEEQDRIFIYNVHFIDVDTLLISGFVPYTYPYEITFIYRSTDKGQTWNKIMEADINQGEGYIAILSLIMNDNILYAAFYGQGIFQSDDWGLTWTPVFLLDNTIFYQLEFDPINGIFYTNTANIYEIPGKTVIYRSLDAINWQVCSQSFQEDYWVVDMEINPNESGQIFCSVFNREHYQLEAPHFIYSEDSGETWDEIYFDEFDPTNHFTNSKIIAETNEILVCPIGKSIYRNELNFVETEELMIKNPNFSLSNYPNPFNPTTNIYFSLNTSLRQGYAGQAENTEDTEIIIYNIKGQKVKTLDVSGSCRISTVAPMYRDYSITWNGTDENNQLVSSGVYMYQLKVDGKAFASRKCLLLK